MDIRQMAKKCILLAHQDRSINTARTYKNGIDLFIESLDLDPCEEIELTIENFIEFPAWMSSRGYSKQTLRVYASAANYFLEWMVINGYIPPPDYQQTLRYKLAFKTIVKKRQEAFVRFPQKGEAEKMIDAVIQMDEEAPIKERNIAIVNFLYFTGCRNAEIAGLLVRDIDMNDKSAIVTGKGSKERRVFFNDKTADLLRNYWNIRGYSSPNHPAFSRHDRAVADNIKPLTTTSIRNIVNDVCKIAGIDKGLFTPHYFRHAFAIKMLKETNNLALVQDLMGHSSPASTRVYAKIYPEDLKQAHTDAFGR